MPETIITLAGFAFLLLVGYFSILILLLGAGMGIAWLGENAFGGSDSKGQRKIETLFVWIFTGLALALWIWSLPLRLFGFKTER